MPHTALYSEHIAAGGRMVDFSGWQMPVQYSGILAEHKAVREAVGVFDISHMGEFRVRGAGAGAWLDSLLTNRVANLSSGEAQYSSMLNDEGGVLDDLIVYRLREEEFLLVVNASRIAKDASWLYAHHIEGVSLCDCSSDFAAIAIQGPKSPEVFQKLFSLPMPSERNRIVELGSTCRLALTTGYTGEDGFEWLMPHNEAAAAWHAAIDAGALPCGLGARDTLRLEMCYPLNGSDLSQDRTPLEAGLGFFVDLTKPSFPGKDVLVAQKTNGIPSRLTAVRVTADKAPPVRPHYPVWANGQKISETTSGALSPSLGYGIAMAYLPPELSEPGQPVEIEVRGRKFAAVVQKKPFYQKKP